MRKALAALTASVASLLVMAACSPLVGTWRGEKADADSPVTFGTVSFAGDGTFTCTASYTEPGGQSVTRTASGFWSTCADDQVIVGRRKYRYAVTGRTVIFTDPETNRSMILSRIAH